MSELLGFSFSCQDSAGFTGSVRFLPTHHTRQRLNVESPSEFGATGGARGGQGEAERGHKVLLDRSGTEAAEKPLTYFTLSFQQQVQVAVGRFVLTGAVRLKSHVSERE